MNVFYDREYAEEQQQRKEAYRNNPEREARALNAMYWAGWNMSHMPCVDDEYWFTAGGRFRVDNEDYWC